MRLFLAPIRFLDAWLEQIVIGVLCTVLVVTLTYSAFVRYFVPIPFFTSFTHNAEELAVFSFIWLLYWGSVLATKEGAHFRVYAQFALLPKAWRRWQFLPGDIIWLVFNLFVVWQGTLLVESALEHPEYSLSLQIPMEYIYAIIPLAFLLTCFRLVQSYLRRRPPEGPTVPLSQL